MREVESVAAGTFGVATRAVVFLRMQRLGTAAKQSRLCAYNVLARQPRGSSSCACSVNVRQPCRSSSAHTDVYRVEHATRAAGTRVSERLYGGSFWLMRSGGIDDAWSRCVLISCMLWRKGSKALD
ncbi:hypothetical protein GUJ93_ZPchr0008g14038 [Zizania palustris]|uniref:Uncharacterized protein n=1 Tax=Zizania palustris TaxID=103762 RepID=A0A8J5RPR6_ZIZPA|nr:hypothetical protein GUJ93_ZPchr0008g14038 [Zizania palustris]